MTNNILPQEECTVWLQLGSEPKFHNKHKIDKNASKAGLNSEKLAIYLSLDDQTFSILPQSLLCNGCYQDFRKHTKETASNTEPRWAKVHRILPFSPEKHCPVCHVDAEKRKAEPCKFTSRWQREWSFGMSHEMWKKIFRI